MNAEELERQIKLALVNSGFYGKSMDLTEAKRISNSVLETYREDLHYDIKMELAPIHTVGGKIRCNCDASKIKIVNLLKKKS